MAINFPDNPVFGQTFSSSGNTWEWNGSVWNIVPAAAVSVQIGSVTSGSPASVTNSGSTNKAVLNFVLPKGDPGQGVPVGGTSGQALIKNSSTDYDASWSFSLTNLINQKVSGADAQLYQFNRRTASYILAAADMSTISNRRVIEMNLTTANTVTVPLNSSVQIPVGSMVYITQYGTGKTTIQGASGVNVRSLGGLLSVAGQYGWVTLIKVATDEWYAHGDLID